jgi:hypothetical protein
MELTVFLDNTPKCLGVHLFMVCSNLDSKIKIEYTKEKNCPSLVSDDIKLSGTITVLRYLNRLAEDKSLLIRKNSLDTALVNKQITN